MQNRAVVKKHITQLISAANKLASKPLSLGLAFPILSLYDEIYQNTPKSDERTKQAKGKLSEHRLLEDLSNDLKNIVMALIDLRDDLKPYFKSAVLNDRLAKTFGESTDKTIAGEDDLKTLISEMRVSEEGKNAIATLAAAAIDDEKLSPTYSPDLLTLRLVQTAIGAEEFKVGKLGEIDDLDLEESELLGDKIYLAALKEALIGYNTLVNQKKIKDPVIKVDGESKQFASVVDAIIFDLDKKPVKKMEEIKKLFEDVRPKLGKVDNVHADRLNRFIGLLNKGLRKLGGSLPYYRSEKAKEIKQHMHTIFVKVGVKMDEVKKPKKGSKTKRSPSP